MYKRIPSISFFAFTIYLLTISCLLVEQVDITIQPTITAQLVTRNTSTSLPSSTMAISPTPYYPGLIVFPQIKMEYYDIQGATAEELVDEIFEKGPTAGFEHSLSVAAIEYDLWHTWPGRGLDTCELNKAETGYTLKIIAPRWQPPSEASPELIEAWIIFMEEVKAHEEVHLNLIREYYALLKNTIAKSTCLTAWDAADRVELDLLRAHDDFDRNSEPAEFP